MNISFLCIFLPDKNLLGFIAKIPQKCAGIRTDPPISVPMPNTAPLPDINAASPPLDPPDVLAGFHGFLTGPNTGLELSIPNKSC